MLPIEHIRSKVFKLSQAPFAEVAGVTQPTVSRWERGEFPPNQDQLERIRRAALERALPWDDAWFFEVPVEEPTPSTQSPSHEADAE
jgi:transcriptional regulator with XRE-family HTH domain